MERMAHMAQNLYLSTELRLKIIRLRLYLVTSILSFLAPKVSYNRDQLEVP